MTTFLIILAITVVASSLLIAVVGGVAMFVALLRDGEEQAQLALSRSRHPSRRRP